MNKTGANLSNVAELYVKHQVNLIFICFEPKQNELNIAEEFV